MGASVWLAEFTARSAANRRRRSPAPLESASSSSPIIGLAAGGAQQAALVRFEEDLDSTATGLGASSDGMLARTLRRAVPVHCICIDIDGLVLIDVALNITRVVSHLGGHGRQSVTRLM